MSTRSSPAARDPLLHLPERGLNLHTLKAVIRRADLVITNDTGTRHVAAALGTPRSSPSSARPGPEWTEIPFGHERHVIAPGPLDPRGESDRKHPSRTMNQIPIDDVYDAAVSLLETAK